MTQVQVQNAAGEELAKVKIDSTKPLLSQLQSEGIEIPNACKIWMCAACLCTIQSWQEHVVKNLRWEPSFPLWDEEIMTCIGGVKETDEEIILQTMS